MNGIISLISNISLIYNLTKNGYHILRQMKTLNDDYLYYSQKLYNFVALKKKQGEPLSYTKQQQMLASYFINNNDYLIVLIANGELEKIQRMITDGVVELDLQYNDNEPLKTAIAYHRPAIYKYLICCGCPKGLKPEWDNHVFDKHEYDGKTHIEVNKA